MKGKTIMFRDDQIDFVEDQSQRFNISTFVRDKLDEYIKFVGGMKNGKKTINK